MTASKRDSKKRLAFHPMKLRKQEKDSKRVSTRTHLAENSREKSRRNSGTVAGPKMMSSTVPRELVKSPEREPED